MIRLIRMADGAQTIALHPGGGTHVRRSFEIGSVDLGRIEMQGRQTRRVTVLPRRPVPAMCRITGLLR